jgi:hypothetical protein
MPMIVMERLPSVRVSWPMKRVGTLACILFAVVGAPAGLAKKGLSVDWKFYGGASLDGDSECFYDAKGVVQGPDGHIRVWTKCLLQKDMDSIDIKKDFNGKILENTAQKIANQYVPPIATVKTIDVNQNIVITQYEETANIGNIQPHTNIFYELNCSERMLRELSIQYVRGSSLDKPSHWKYVPPEGNGASLLKILCPLR